MWVKFEPVKENFVTFTVTFTRPLSHEWGKDAFKHTVIWSSGEDTDVVWVFKKDSD